PTFIRRTVPFVPRRVTTTGEAHRDREGGMGKPVQHGDARQGILYGLAAYGWWGLVPLYFKVLTDAAPPLEVFAHRIVWSVLLLAALLALLHRWADLARCLTTPRLRHALLGTTLLIAVNWFMYIYGVSTAQVVQTSLGYFITPLVNVVLGVWL